MEKNLIHSNELHFIDKKRIHRAVEQLVESLELAAGSTTGFNLYAVVESYFTDLDKRSIRNVKQCMYIDTKRKLHQKMQLPFCIIFLPYSDSLSILCLMYRQLRERETDSFLVEYSINGLVHIKINSPVITALHPNTDNEVHAAGLPQVHGARYFPPCRNSRRTPHR